MFAEDLHTIYKNLNDSLILPAEEVNESAVKLVDAPEDDFITKKMRLEVIVMHPNYSRETYELLLRSFEAETLTSEDTNVLHMLLSNRNATLEDVKTLHEFADNSGNVEWFHTVVRKTIDLNEYQLNLSYNGESVFHNEELRNTLTQTIELLQKFQNES
jgi:hypothetical protein